MPTRINLSEAIQTVYASLYNSIFYATTANPKRTFRWGYDTTRLKPQIIVSIPSWYLGMVRVPCNCEIVSFLLETASTLRRTFWLLAVHRNPPCTEIFTSQFTPRDQSIIGHVQFFRNPRRRSAALLTGPCQSTPLTQLPLPVQLLRFLLNLTAMLASCRSCAMRTYSATWLSAFEMAPPSR